jgi:hypothetical protein
MSCFFSCVQVGVGTTVGAGIFVTTAVVAAVTFVADVRLARRSFVRDVLFFIFTVGYLFYTTSDGVITLMEAVGFMLIYVAFVLVRGNESPWLIFVELCFVQAVGGIRWYKMLRGRPPTDAEEEDGALHVWHQTFRVYLCFLLYVCRGGSRYVYRRRGG